MARQALSATRAVAVLNFLASHATEQYSLSDLSDAMDINLASAHALMGALQESGYVVRHPRLRTYRLGPSVVALGAAALECHPAIDHAREEARRLSKDLGLAVAVSAVAGGEIVFLGRFGEHRGREMEAHVGQRIPLVPPVGAVFAAWADPGPWLEQSDDPGSLARGLDAVRERGWAASSAPDDYRVLGPLDADESYDVVMIAAPVFDPSGGASVALTLLGLPPSLPAGRIQHYGRAVRDAGLVATRRSGGRPPERQEVSK